MGLRALFRLILVPVVRFRSAITGRFVTVEYAEEHPDTTVSETEKAKD
jgi:hypothetical protein